MSQDSEYDFEDTGDLVCWDTVYHTTVTSNKKINVVYTKSEERKDSIEHNQE